VLSLILTNLPADFVTQLVGQNVTLDKNSNFNQADFAKESFVELMREEYISAWNIEDEDNGDSRFDPDLGYGELVSIQN
jgi:hypothetical protein